MTELDAHLATACAGSDVEAETARHATAMESTLAHEMDDVASMEGMMGGRMMSGGGCR